LICTGQRKQWPLSKKIAIPTVKVRRDGSVKEISARYLVPGDIILLESGNSVPADARLVESINLRTQEAALTGESEPVEKTALTLSGENLPLGDRLNIVYMVGTLQNRAKMYGVGSKK